MIFVSCLGETTDSLQISRICTPLRVDEMQIGRDEEDKLVYEKKFTHLRVGILRAYIRSRFLLIK